MSDIVCAGNECEKEAFAKLCVLVVDDQVVNQVILRKMLEKDGHSVVVVNNGKEAVDRCESQYFDLIMMDISMPVMDGREASMKIRQLEKTRGASTPIIAVSAHRVKDEWEQCRAVGINGYIEKPVTIQKVRELLSTVFL